MVDALTLGSPSAPQTLASFLVARAELFELEKGLLGQLEHALCGHARDITGREYSENIGWCDARVRDVAREEDAFAEGRVGMDVEIFVAACVRSSSWKRAVRKCTPGAVKGSTNLARSSLGAGQRPQREFRSSSL